MTLLSTVLLFSWGQCPIETELKLKGETEMAFAARKSGICSRCTRPILIGQFIVWNRSLKGKAYHATCPSGPFARETQPAQTTEITDQDEWITDQDEWTPDKATVEAWTAEPTQQTDLAASIAAAIQSYLPKPQAGTASIDEDAVRKIVQAELSGTEPTRLTFSLPNLPDITVEHSHPQLPKVVRLLQMGLYPYLYNGAGAGKTHAAQQAATILGYALDETFVLTCNPFSSPIELTGYTDAHGKLVEKPFLRAFSKGGFVIIDEADRARPDFLPALNSALANRTLTAPDGTIVVQHERFMLVCTGNTPMRGADRNYNSASKQDASVIDRLFFVGWHYDEKLERSLCATQTHGTVWVNWIHSVRKYVDSDNSVADVLVTMRACINGLKMINDDSGLFDMRSVIDGVLLKGVSSDTAARILNACPIPEVR